MKVIGIEQAIMDSCVNAAQRERIVITRDGRPVALIVGIEGLDQEQLDLGSNARFWELITERRSQRVISRAELEQEIYNKGPDH